MTASNSFEYFCHSEMKDKKLSLTQEQYNTLKEIYVERLCLLYTSDAADE